MKVEYRDYPGFVMDVLDERPCEQPDHKAYKVIDPERAEDWLCEFDIRFLDEPNDAD